MDIDNTSFLNSLNEKQKSVCVSTDNILLTACPGSGKTRTIIYRLAYLRRKYESSRLFDIAITYTNRAANEIEDRLERMNIDTTSIWTGTIHSFCMNFIIRPYAMYSEDLRKGYHVIDEFIKSEYCHELANKLNIDVGYKDPLSFPKIAEEYYTLLRNNKEIDFDMILSYSLDLLKDNDFIAQNIAMLIRSIHVDEYQDTNVKQYQILKYLIQQNSKINLLFIGDVNQAIYRNLGGIAKDKDSLEEEYKISFTAMCLDGCYRSTQRIIDFYRRFEIQATGATAVSDIKDIQGIISYDSSIHQNKLAERIAEIIQNKMNEGITPNDICIVAPQWYQIFPMAVQLRKLLPGVSFDAPEISPFKYDPMNPFYLISRLVYSEAGINSQRRRKIVYEIFSILFSEYRIKKPDGFDVHDFLKIVNSVSKDQPDGIDVFSITVEKLLYALNIDLQSEPELNKVYCEFLKKVHKRIKDKALPHSYNALCQYFKERQGIVITTIHSIKGEEYHTVIAFDLLNMHLPHSSYLYEWDKKPYRRADTNRILYVLCSRAKHNLYLFSEVGRTTRNGNALTPTDELYSVRYKYD